MVRVRRCLWLLVLPLAGCANLMPVQPREGGGMQQEAESWLEAFPSYQALPADRRQQWARAAGALMEAELDEEALEQSLESDAGTVDGLGAAMTDLVNSGFNQAPVPNSLESSIYPRLLVQAHSPLLVMRLIGPSLAEGQPLENVLTEGDPELAQMLEQPEGSTQDPSFGLYLEVLEAAGLESPVSKALLRRMFHVRPLRAMDLMLTRYPAELPDAIRIFRIHQGVRLRVMLQGIGQAETNENFEWMMRELTPLREHRSWWVQLYAQRVLELGVGGKLHLEGGPM